MTHLAILCVKNEAAFLLEWLAHHRAVGFDHFIVFSNDCEDGTDTMLDLLQQNGWLTHINNPGPYHKGGIQFTALNTVAKMDAFRTADWAIALDIDEFVNIHVGDHTLTALHQAIPGATAITMTWRLFGNAGVTEYQDTPITETFTKCAPKVFYWPWRAAMFKTLYHNDGTYTKPGVHRPRSPDQAKLRNARWYDGNGHPLPDPFKTKRIFSNFGRNNYGLVQLNHYPLGAMQSYLLKADRGRAVHHDQMLGLDYWADRNFSSDTDTSISSVASQRSEILAQLKSDAALSSLHEHAVAWRHQRFEQLMMSEPNRALYGRLLMSKPSEPLPMDSAQKLLRYGKQAADRANS